MKTCKKLFVIMTPVLFLGLAGCAATYTSLNKRNLDVQTRMSETIFLEPVAPAQKTAYVQVKNTSGNHQLDLENQVKTSLHQKGYTLVSNPKQAHYLVQANVLHVGKADLKDVNSMFDSGFGGGLVGAAAAGALGGDARTALGVGLAGLVVGMAADAMVKDNLYTIVTDIQISEKTKTKVKEASRARLQQGTGTKVVTSTTDSNYNRYQTRIVSTANKVNLKLEEAVPQLVAGISSSITGIM
jgi:hypothetical protein